MQTQHVLTQAEIAEAILEYCGRRGTPFDPERTALQFRGKVDNGDLMDLSVIVQGNVRKTEDRKEPGDVSLTIKTGRES